jgi:type IV secretory pathway TraG/TraD family ATPase VirD4
MSRRHRHLHAGRHHAAALRRFDHLPAGAATGLPGRLWALTIPLLIGLGAGAALSWALKRHHLRWTWALFGAPLAYLLFRLDKSVGGAVGVATVVAAGFGIHAHQEAIQHGGEDARKMRDTVGPLRWAWTKLRSRHAIDERVKGETLAIGRNPRGEVCRVPFGVSRGVHALVAGATGSGKTVDLTAISCAHVGAGQGVIVANPKPDGDMRARLEAAAAQAGVGFHHWSPTGSTVYNPLARGNPTEIADKALAGHQWSEPHYELATQRLLLQVLPTLREAGIWPPSVADLARYMAPARLEKLAAKLSEETAQRVNDYLDGLGARGVADLAGGRDRLAVLADGQLGPLLGNPGPGQASIDLAAAALAAGDVVYFDLDADRYPAAAKLLGAALVIDLVGLTADLQGGQAGGLLVIDEFSAIAAAQVERLFARARSAGLSLLLGTQSLADLRAASADERSDTLTEKILSNIEFAIVHRIGDPDSAERFARMAGTVPSWSTTQRVSGNGSIWGKPEGTRTREREFIVLPDQFKRLRVGEAIVINPAAKRSAEVVKIWPPAGVQG